MKHILTTAFLLITGIAVNSFVIPKPQIQMETDNQITLTILYDNYQYDKRF